MAHACPQPNVHQPLLLPSPCLIIIVNVSLLRSPSQLSSLPSTVLSSQLVSQQLRCCHRCRYSSSSSRRASFAVIHAHGQPFSTQSVIVVFPSAAVAPLALHSSTVAALQIASSFRRLPVTVNSFLKLSAIFSSLLFFSAAATAFHGQLRRKLLVSCSFFSRCRRTLSSVPSSALLSPFCSPPSQHSISCVFQFGSIIGFWFLHRPRHKFTQLLLPSLCRRPPSSATTVLCRRLLLRSASARHWFMSQLHLQPQQSSAFCPAAASSISSQFSAWLRLIIFRFQPCMSHASLLSLATSYSLFVIVIMIDTLLMMLLS